MIETILVQLMVLYVAGIVTSLSLGAFHFFASSRRARHGSAEKSSLMTRWKEQRKPSPLTSTGSTMSGAKPTMRIGRWHGKSLAGH